MASMLRQIPTTPVRGTNYPLSFLMLALVMAISGCDKENSDPSEFRVEAFNLEGMTQVELNHPMEWEFTEDVSRWSLPADSADQRSRGASIEIVERDTGAPARGSFLVNGTVVRFEPALPNNPDLDDAGLRPSTTYDVTVHGFPRLNVVRTMNNAPVKSGVQFEFSTISGDHPGCFFDTSSEPLQLIRRNGALAEGETLNLSFNKPLDPRTVIPRNFKIFESLDGESNEKTIVDIEVDNRLEGAVVQFYLESSPFAGTRYHIQVLPELLDLGQNSCLEIRSEARFLIERSDLSPR